MYISINLTRSVVRELLSVSLWCQEHLISLYKGSQIKNTQDTLLKKKSSP